MTAAHSQGWVINLLPGCHIPCLPMKWHADKTITRLTATCSSSPVSLHSLRHGHTGHLTGAQWHRLGVLCEADNQELPCDSHHPRISLGEPSQLRFPHRPHACFSHKRGLTTWSQCHDVPTLPKQRAKLGVDHLHAVAHRHPLRWIIGRR
eukprot:COSAG01_NODE_1619_length_9715_cov_29.912958_7_plen_150_part_00